MGEDCVSGQNTLKIFERRLLVQPSVPLHPSLYVSQVTASSRIRAANSKTDLLS